MIAVLQPHIPHYREAFFKGLNDYSSTKVYCYESTESAERDNFKKADVETIFLKSYSIGPFMWYDLNPFLSKKVNTLVLMLDFKHLSTWLLLLTQFIHGKKIILWGQGISIKNFLKQEKTTFLPLKLFLKLSDGVWCYTTKELDMWKKRMPALNAVALNNTISGIADILKVPMLYTHDKEVLKEKYGIKQPLILIFCARFNAVRRIDLLLDVIEKVDSEKIGFVIIGSGEQKPSFKNYAHVYDFGSVYDFSLKTELFSLSDIYFQPGWLGLSVVEAMAYGKPVFSFVRSKSVYQCVEYAYIGQGYNGELFNSKEELLDKLDKIKLKEIDRLGKNARDFCITKLSINNMVQNAVSLL